jgi:hypothetical protein
MSSEHELRLVAESATRNSTLRQICVYASQKKQGDFSRGMLLGFEHESSNLEDLSCDENSCQLLDTLILHSASLQQLRLVGFDFDERKIEALFHAMACPTRSSRLDAISIFACHFQGIESVRLFQTMVVACSLSTLRIGGYLTLNVLTEDQDNILTDFFYDIIYQI